MTCMAAPLVKRSVRVQLASVDDATLNPKRHNGRRSLRSSNRHVRRRFDRNVDRLAAPRASVSTVDESHRNLMPSQLKRERTSRSFRRFRSDGSRCRRRTTPARSHGGSRRGERPVRTWSREGRAPHRNGRNSTDRNNFASDSSRLCIDAERGEETRRRQQLCLVRIWTSLSQNGTPLTLRRSRRETRPLFRPSAAYPGHTVGPWRAVPAA